MDRALSLDDLQAVDPRSLSFTPGGTRNPASPEVAVAHFQRYASTLILAPGVGELTRQQFERLRAAFVYGVLNFDFFAMVTDAARLGFEQALRDRFMAFHQGVVHVRDGRGNEHSITARTYEDFFERMQGLRGGRPQIQIAGSWTSFDGMLDALIRWARSEGLLRGGRSRRTEAVLKRLRNKVAHGSFQQANPQVLSEAFSALSTLAEIINELWGHPTPGGRLYPAPIKREVLFIGWSGDGDEVTAGLAEQLARDTARRSAHWRYALVRAVHWSTGQEDPNLLEYDSLHATTAYPTELLQGPLTGAEALAWLAEHDPQPDVCNYLDQVFLVRVHDGHILLPMYPNIAAGLTASERAGTWYVVRADAGLDAFNHVRALASGAHGHPASGWCLTCGAETLARAEIDSALRTAAKHGSDTTPVVPADVRVFARDDPRSFPLPAVTAPSGP